MSLLFRYIFRRHARLLLLIMGLGVGLYLLTDIVERVDIFIEAGSGLGLILQYFGVRLPSIIAQILPAVFLLATVVTLCLMGHSRELTALHAGGISFFTVAMVLVFCGVFWGGVQFACSQFLGVQGERYSQQIWREEVRKQDLSQRTIRDVWFMENGWTVSIDALKPDGEGTGFSAFHVRDDASDVDVIIRAPPREGRRERLGRRRCRTRAPRYLPARKTAPPGTAPASGPGTVLLHGIQQPPAASPLAAR